MPKKAVVSDEFFVSESPNTWTCVEGGGGGGWMSKSELIYV